MTRRAVSNLYPSDTYRSQIVRLGKRYNRLTVVPNFDLSTAPIDHCVNFHLVPNAGGHGDGGRICVWSRCTVVAVCKSAVLGDEYTANRNIGRCSQFNEVGDICVLADQIETDAVIHRALLTCQRRSRVCGIAGTLRKGRICAGIDIRLLHDHAID
jgi:hypothetical protein